MITDRDYEIIKHLEKYKYATLSQLEKVFFKSQQYSYNIARKRMLEIKKADYIKVHRDLATNKNVYIYNEDKIKIPNLHRLLVLDVLAEMQYNGFNIEVFEIEKFWGDGKIRSDAFAIFTVNDRRYHLFVEVQLSNNYHNLEKYDNLYGTGYVQQYLNKEFFPSRILLISDQNYSEIKLNHAKVIQLNTKLDGFATVLI